MLGCIDYVLKFSMFRSREDKTIKNKHIIQHFKDNQIINAIASVYLEGSVIFYFGYNFTYIQQKNRISVVDKLRWTSAYVITIMCYICYFVLVISLESFSLIWRRPNYR